MRKKACLILAMVMSFLMVMSQSSPGTAMTDKDEAKKKPIMEKALKMQMPFIANSGQIQDSNVRFYANTFSGAVYVTKSGEIVYSLRMSEEKSSDKPDGKNHHNNKTKLYNLKESFVNASAAKTEGMDKSDTKVNYFVGNDKNKWQTNIPTYQAVSLGQIYKGIELRLNAHGGSVEKVFAGRPGC